MVDEDEIKFLIKMIQTYKTQAICLGFIFTTSFTLIKPNIPTYNHLLL